MLQLGAVCCSVLQCENIKLKLEFAKKYNEVCCSVMQYGAMCVVPCVAVCLHFAAVCYSVLHCVLAVCSVLQFVAVQRGAVCCSVLQCVAVCYSVLCGTVPHFVAVCDSVLYCVAVCSSVVQCVFIVWTHSHVCHGSFTCLPLRVDSCVNRTRGGVRFLRHFCVPGLIHTRNITHPPVCHDIFTCMHSCVPRTVDS